MNRRHRLISSRDFDRVFANGKRGASGVLSCVATRRDDSNAVRVGITANKRVGGAVARNRSKRLLREATRALIANVPPGSDVVLVARPACAKSTLERVRQDLEVALRRAGAFC